MIAPSAAPDARHPANWAQLLEQAAREVFEMMLGCSLTPSPTVTDQTPDITSMVGLAGELCGLLSVRCQRAAAILMASKMLGIEPAQVGAEMHDAFGEIGNMVAGNFKNKVPGLGDGCMLSVPTVVSGTDYSLHSKAATPAIEIQLLFETMPLVISLQISE